MRGCESPILATPLRSGTDVKPNAWLGKEAHLTFLHPGLPAFGRTDGADAGEVAYQPSVLWGGWQAAPPADWWICKKPRCGRGKVLGKFWLARCAGLVNLFCMATMLKQQARRPTCDDHLQREGNQRHEIIDGNPLIASAPELRHHAKSVI